MQIQKKHLIAFLIISAAIILRLYKWLDYGLWYDEVLWVLSSKSLFSIKEFSTFLLKPPLFGILLFVWEKLATKELFLRLPCMIFGLLSIYVSYRIAKVLFNRKTALITAVMITFSPFHIYYSQELTHYSLTFLLASLSMYFFVVFLQEKEWYCLVKYIIATIACIYTNYMCLFLIPVQNIFIFLHLQQNKTFIKRWLFSQGVVLIFILLLVDSLFGSLFTIMNSDDLRYHWIPRGDLRYIVQTFNVFNLGYNSTQVLRIAAAAIFIPLFLGGIWTNRNSSKRWLLPLLWLFLPMFLSISIAYVFKINTYTHRNFIYSSLAYYLLTASGVSRLSKNYRFVALTIVIILSVVSLINYYNNCFFTPEELFRPGVHAKKDNRQMAKYIMENFKDGDTVLHVCPCTNLPFFYYISNSNTANQFIKNMADEYYAKKHLIAVSDRNNINQYTRGYKRVWFVFSHWEPATLYSPNSKERQIKSAFDNMYRLVKKKKFEGIEVYLYDINNSACTQ